MPGVADVCGGNPECLFDVGSTGVLAVGNVTLGAQRDFSETLELTQPSKLVFYYVYSNSFPPPLLQLPVTLPVKMELPVWTQTPAAAVSPSPALSARMVIASH